jgi:hypothetical protein
MLLVLASFALATCPGQWLITNTTFLLPDQVST